MKIKFKLSFMMIAILVIVVTVISIVELRKATEISLDLSLRGIQYLAEDMASTWKSKGEGNIRALRTLANVMSDRKSVV